MATTQRIRHDGVVAPRDILRRQERRDRANIELKEIDQETQWDPREKGNAVTLRTSAITGQDRSLDKVKREVVKGSP